jgi:arginine decarboxylase
MKCLSIKNHFFLFIVIALFCLLKIHPAEGSALDIREYPVLIITDKKGQNNENTKMLSAILDELKSRCCSIIFSNTFEDGKIAFDNRKDISTIVINYGIVTADNNNIKACANLIDYMDNINPTLPIYLMSEDLSLVSVPNEILKKTNGYIVLGEDTPTIVAERILIRAESYLDNILPPIFKNLVEYVNRARQTWVVPGHGGGPALLETPVGMTILKFFGENIFRADVSTGIPHFGSVLEHTGSVAKGESEAAETFGSDLTFFVLNGGSTSNKIVYTACVNPGDIVLTDRNCHKSSVHGAILSNAVPVYLLPSRNAYGMIGPVHMSEFQNEAIRKKIEASPLVKNKTKIPELSVLTNSTYDGICYDIAEIKPILSESVSNMLFDEAWYSYAKFSPIYTGRYAMSDDGEKPKILTFANQSSHKLLAAFSQSSMMHVKNGTVKKIDPQKYNEAFMMHASTSPFDPMLASIDVSAKMMKGQCGLNFMNKITRQAVTFRKKMASIYRDITGGKPNTENAWWYKLWQPERITLPGSSSVKNKAFEKVDNDILVSDPRCWVLKQGDVWHGFDGIENDNVLLDPIKITLLTPGITEDGTMDDWGIPAMILYKYLDDRGNLGEKTGFYNILFIVSPSVTESKTGTIISAFYKFKDLFDRNAPISKVFPDLVDRYPEQYENIGLKDLCFGMHNFFRQKNLMTLSKEMYESLPEQVMTPAKAYESVVRDNVEYVTLDKLIGRISAVLLAPYPPGIAVIMPGERYTKKCRAVMNYFSVIEEIENRFPGFETAIDIHGMDVEKKDGRNVYKVMCIKE